MRATRVGSELMVRIGRRLVWEWSKLSLRWNDQVRTRWHDLTVTRRFVPVAGAQAGSQRVAIMVLYPADGVQPSHLRSLRHLIAMGYAPLVVSNLPLTEGGRASLLPLVWQLAERRNFGFDIGGYRAAILWLGQRLAGLERLVLTNDSIWFPTGDRPDWLSVAARIDSGHAPSLIGAVPGISDGRSRDGSFRPDQGAGDFHYCSFALSFGPAILRDADFLPFWRRLRLTDRKVEIVQRGEVATSQWAIRRGHDHASTWDPGVLPQQLMALRDSQLRSLVSELVIPEDAGLRAARDAFLADRAASSDAGAVLRLVLDVIARTGAAYALPCWTMRSEGLGFIKKSPLRLDATGRAATLRALQSEPELLAEAEKIRLRE